MALYSFENFQFGSLFGLFDYFCCNYMIQSHSNYNYRKELMGHIIE